MAEQEGTSQEEVDDLGAGESGGKPERGCYGQALREGWVRRPPPAAPRTVDLLLWVFNVVIGLFWGPLWHGGFTRFILPEALEGNCYSFETRNDS